MWQQQDQARPATASFKRRAHSAAPANRREENRSSVTTSCPNKMEPFTKAITKAVDKAIKERKVFTIYGNFPAIRNALLKRNWIEKLPQESQNANNYIKEIMDQVKRGHGAASSQDAPNNTASKPENIKEKGVLLKSLLLHSMNAPPNFLWTTRRNYFIGDQSINRFPCAAQFTTKTGLCNSFQNQYLLPNDYIAWQEFIPRCYLICTANGRESFIRDFRLTACFSVLKWLVEQTKELQEVQILKEMPNSFGRNTKTVAQQNQVPLETIKFALKISQECVTQCKLQASERTCCTRSRCISTLPTEDNWKQFIVWYYKLIHYKRKLQFIPPETLKSLANESEYVLGELGQYFPQLKSDGTENIWIVKPGAKSKGIGIQLYKKMEQILQYFNVNKTSSNREYVVQKYIEKPLLIYSTKFDIRQWFMITSWKPLMFWMYQDSYIRFCSKKYSLSDLRPSIHLCNNAIQSQYNFVANNLLPREKMWDCHTFQTFLTKNGFPHAWYQFIYPRMMEKLLRVVISSQTQNITSRKKAFELYGADFLLTEDLQPWLIEINSDPSMTGSTSVSKKLCTQCFEDIIKVVIDRKNGKACDTGRFELVHKESRFTMKLSEKLLSYLPSAPIGRKARIFPSRAVKGKEKEVSPIYTKSDNVGLAVTNDSGEDKMKCASAGYFPKRGEKLMNRPRSLYNEATTKNPKQKLASCGVNEQQKQDVQGKKIPASSAVVRRNTPLGAKNNTTTIPLKTAIKQNRPTSSAISKPAATSQNKKNLPFSTKNNIIENTACDEKTMQMIVDISTIKPNPNSTNAQQHRCIPDTTPPAVHSTNTSINRRLDNYSQINKLPASTSRTTKCTRKEDLAAGKKNDVNKTECEQWNAKSQRYTQGSNDIMWSRWQTGMCYVAQSTFSDPKSNTPKSVTGHIILKSTRAKSTDRAAKKSNRDRIGS